MVTMCKKLPKIPSQRLAKRTRFFSALNQGSITSPECFLLAPGVKERLGLRAWISYNPDRLLQHLTSSLAYLAHSCSRLLAFELYDVISDLLWTMWSSLALDLQKFINSVIVYSTNVIWTQGHGDGYVKSKTITNSRVEVGVQNETKNEVVKNHSAVPASHTASHILPTSSAVLVCMFSLRLMSCSTS